MRRLEGIANRLGLDPRALIGLVVLLSGTIVWLLAFTGGFASLLSSSATTIRADFPSIEDVVPNDPVRVHGVQVGKVASVSADPGGRGGTLTMDLDSSAGKIYRNASASIVWRTVLGANDAVALDPGTPAAGSLGGATLPQSQDSSQVELDQIVQAFHGGAQQGMRTMLQQLAPAFAAHPALAQDLGVLARIAPQATVGIGALRGEVQDADLRNLVRNAGQAARALDVGTGGSETQRFVQSAAQTLSAVSADQAALRQSISGLAADLPLLTRTFIPFNHDLNDLDPLLAKLTPEVSQVAPTLQVLHPTLIDANHLLTDATPLLRKLRPTVDSLARTAQIGVPVINELAPGLRQTADNVLPGLAIKSPEEGGRPAYAEIGPTVVGVGTLSNFFDQNGNFANLTAGLGDYQSQQVLPCQLDFTGTDYLVCESLSQALADVFGGGSSLLQSLAARPGGADIFGPLLSRAKQLEAQFAATRRALAAKAPAVGRLLFAAHQGSRR